MTEDVLDLATQIVSAHVARDPVPIEELLALIREVYKTLSTVRDAAAPGDVPKPAVPAAKSVFADYIVCLEDGRQMMTLKRHLMAEHNLTVDQYRAKWRLPPNYPMISPSYAKTRSALAKHIGLGRSRVTSAKKPTVAT
jgi:predicted transcriptional regulator